MKTMSVRAVPFIGICITLLFLTGCGTTGSMITEGATNDITYKTSFATFEKVRGGMSLGDLSGLGLGPDSPGVTKSTLGGMLKNIWQFNERGEPITPLPRVIKDQCIDAASQGEKECYVLIVKRKWEEEQLVSSQIMRVVGKKKYRGNKQLFEIALFMSPRHGVIYKTELNVTSNNPTTRAETDYFKHIEGVSGTIIGIGISSSLGLFD